MIMKTTEARKIRYVLSFREPAGTSRGVLTERPTWFLELSRAGVGAVGECAVFPGLSCDDVPDYADVLEDLCLRINGGQDVKPEEYVAYPSIRFGLETAILRLDAAEKGSEMLSSDFTDGKDSVPVNGLVWMGTLERMMFRIKEKVDAGYACIKIKIGAINFDDELSMLAYIRREFTEKDLELRVDANGAFSPSDALERLKRLSEFSLHSIEQPLRAGQREETARLCALSPVPVALDEELIGVNRPQEKKKLIEDIRPQYIVLKPSLTGGYAASKEWMDVAAEAGAGYWVTSALESNVGLDAIARFAYMNNTGIAQGLGTGGLYTNNVPYPFAIRGGRFSMTGKVPGADSVAGFLSGGNTPPVKQDFYHGK